MNASILGQRWRAAAATAVTVLCIIALALKMAWNVDQVRDLLLADETIYLAHGCCLAERGLPRPEGNPLYCVWYFLLSQVASDRIQLYYLNWITLSCLLPISLYALVRALGGARLAGLLAAFGLIYCRLLDVWPYPSHLATALVLLGTAWALRLRSWIGSSAVVTLTLLVAAYVRPEWSAAFCLAVVAQGLIAVRAWRNGLVTLPAVMTPCLATLLATGALLGIFGNPLASSRSLVAFGQHYAVNVASTRQEANPPNPWLHWTDYVHHDFGKVDSFSAAARQNPQAVLWHVGRNLSMLPRETYRLILPRFAIGTGPKLLRDVPIFFAILIGLIGFVRMLKRPPQDTPIAHSPAAFLLMIALILPPALLANLLIFPRQHYLFVPTLLAFAAVAVGWSVLGRECARKLSLTMPSRVSPFAWTGLMAALVLATPNVAHRWHVSRWFRSEAQPQYGIMFNRTIIEAIRGLPVQAPLRVLEDGYSYTFYVGTPFTYFGFEQWRDGTFRDFLDKNQVDVVILTPNFLHEMARKGETAFGTPRHGSSDDAFAYLPVPGVPVTIAVRRERLSWPDFACHHSD